MTKALWVALVAAAILTLALSPSGTPGIPEVQTRSRLIAQR